MRRATGAWWLTLLGTEPRKKRVAPVMPLLPSTSKSISPFSVRSTMAVAGSPSTVSVRIVTPVFAYFLASASTAAPARLGEPTLKMVRVEWKALARSTARSTAMAAVFDPSVPTRICSYTADDTSGKKRAPLRTPSFPNPYELFAGTGAGKLDRRWLEALDGPENDLVVLDVDDDRLAGPELLPQDLLRQRVFDHALDGPTERPCAHRGVVALVDQEELGGLGQLKTEA